MVYYAATGHMSAHDVSKSIGAVSSLKDGENDHPVNLRSDVT